MQFFSSLTMLSLIQAASTGLSTDNTCTHGPVSRGCWSQEYDIGTDFDNSFPATAREVSYQFELTNISCSPDGSEYKPCLLVNGQYPGPTIRADWGDTVHVTVKNSLQTAGTSIHFHGLRQWHSNTMDGVNGVTECPLAPGSTRTYTFHATQHGTAWYHSHYSSQYGDGVLGPIVIEGPAAANYDVDLGPYMLTDWYNMTGLETSVIALNNLQTPNEPSAAPPQASNLLINGTNQNPSGGGDYNHVIIQQGKKYRLRLINTSVNQYLRVSLDDHLMQVITADFVPVQPFYTPTLLINFRATAVADCLSGYRGQALAVWTYDNTLATEPASVGYVEETGCNEPASLAPYWPRSIPFSALANETKRLDVSITKQVFVPGGDAIFVWALGNTSLDLDLAHPTLGYVMDKDATWPDSYRIIDTAQENGWNFWVIQQSNTSVPIPHPLHLHGHDFFILGKGVGQYTASDAVNLNFLNPLRRDTVTLPAAGWVFLAFRSDNPGAWLFHCHVAFHATQGFAVQFLDLPSQIPAPPPDFEEKCTKWQEYTVASGWQKDGSGV